MKKITKFEELANFDIQLLLERFGKNRAPDEAGGKGLDFGEVKERKGVKSISKYGTLEEVLSS